MRPSEPIGVTRLAAWCWLGMGLLAGCTGAGDTAPSEVLAAAQTTTPTTPATTAPPTTEPDPCTRFETAGGYERMMAVKDGTAPADQACKAAVDLSALALNTYENSLAFSEEFSTVDPAALFTAEFCDAAGIVNNVFAVPVVLWGVTRVQEGETVISYQPFVSEVVQPGGSAPVANAGASSDVGRSCSLDADLIVAPVGGLAPGIAASPAPADDPLASDDPQVWGRALLELDTSDMDIAEYVNRVEDIHSRDVWLHLIGLASSESTAPPEAVTFTVCGSESADLGPDVTGDYAWLVFAAEAESWRGHYLGLFSRGSDRRWRFIGSTKEIDQNVDPADPCALPERSAG